MPHHAGQVLLVEDNAAVLQMGQLMLTRLGYDVVTCASGAEALATFVAAPDRFCLLLVDLVLPDVPGTAVIAACRQVRPTLPVIVWTGDRTALTPQQTTALGIAAVLQKPCSRQELAQMLQQVLAPRVGDPAPEDPAPP
jgi:CheY-like chemotaxis protein